jgi:hypothetical protein
MLLSSPMDRWGLVGGISTNKFTDRFINEVPFLFLFLFLFIVLLLREKYVYRNISPKCDVDANILGSQSCV